MSLETLIADYGLIAVFLGAGIEGETAAVLGGVIAQDGLVSLPLAMAAAVLGSFVADQLFFAFGRHYRDHPRVRRIAARPAFVRALATFERHPVGFIFAFRFLYGLRTASPIAIGTTRVATRRFLMINFAAATLWGALFVTIGYVFGEGFERLIGRLKPGWSTLAVLIALVFAGAAVLWTIRWWRARRA